MKKIIFIVLLSFISCTNESDTLNQSVELNTNEQEGDVLSNNKVYDSMPEMNIDISKKYTAVIKTSMGDMSVEFFTEDAPMTVNNFINLSRDGYYDNVIFHRVIPGFMIQGGDPNTKGDNNASYGTGGHAAKYFGIGNENDSSTWTLPAEFNNIKHKVGILSMARANNPNSGGSQFFICAAEAPHLNGKYTVFGQVIEGLEIIEQIVNQPRDSRDNPNRRIEMKVRIEKRNK